MLNVSDAKKKVLAHLPGSRIEKYVVYKNLFVFQVITSDPQEGHMDPFYSVDRTTGKFEGFPFMLPEHFGPVSELFSKFPNESRPTEN